MLLILVQVGLVFLTSVGWGHLLKRVLAEDAPWTAVRGVLYLLIGFCLQILLLQNLVYGRIPVRYSFVIVLLVGALGCWRHIRTLTAAAGQRSVRPHYGQLITVLALVLLVQGIGAAGQGVSNYYGKAAGDQVRYTLMSEFLLTRSYGITLERVGLEPWLLVILQQQHERMGQSVAQAYIAALTFVDAKTSYAATTFVFILLLAAATLTLARAFALGPRMAMVTAIFVGISPAITRIHLNGFLSQTSTIFVFPALMLLGRRDDLRARERVVITSALLAYQLISYTELYVVAVFLLCCVSMLRIGRRPIPEIARLLSSIALSLVLVAPYFTDAVEFTRQQYHTASTRLPAYDSFLPFAGTLKEWARLFVGPPPGSQAVQYRVLVLTGLLLVILCFWGTCSTSIRRRLQLVLAVLGAWTFLAILLSAVELARYPFSKILEQFTFLWVLLAGLGLSRTWYLVQRSRWSWCRWPLLLVPALLLGGAARDTVREQLEVARGQGGLVVMNRPSFQAAQAYIRHHPDELYVIQEPDSAAAGWLAYAARAGKAYVEAPSIAFTPVDPATMSFARPPANLRNATLVSLAGVKNAFTSNSVPEVEVNNPQGRDEAKGSVWYWLGESMTLYVWRFGDDQSLDEYELSFRAEPGPANPSPRRRISIVGSGMKEPQLLAFEGLQTIRVPVVLASGRSEYLLEEVEPQKQLVGVPNDDRNHMVRVWSFEVSGKRPITPEQAEAAGWLLGPKLLPNPNVTIHNPQGEEGQGGSRWYWMGDRLDIDITRQDSQPEELSARLSFRADSGPAHPSRRRLMLLINRQNGERKILTVSSGGFLTTNVQLVPGVTRFTLEMVEPTEEVNKVPGDPRKLMVSLSRFTISLWAHQPESGARHSTSQ